jgi:hypothetical protein
MPKKEQQFYPTPTNLLSSTPRGTKYTPAERKEIEYRHKKATELANKNYVKPPKGGKGPTKRDLYRVARASFQKINKDDL